MRRPTDPALPFPPPVWDRAGTIRSLRVEQIDLDAAVVRTEVVQQKNKRSHNVPLNPEMVSLLRRYLATKHPNALAFNLDRRQAAMLACDLDAAGLPHETDAGLPLKFHSLRVTCATLLGEAGLNSLQIASVTGHLSRTMVDHYTHSTLATARDAVAKLA